MDCQAPLQTFRQPAQVSTAFPGSILHAHPLETVSSIEGLHLYFQNTFSSILNQCILLYTK